MQKSNEVNDFLTSVFSEYEDLKGVVRVIETGGRNQVNPYPGKAFALNPAVAANWEIVNREDTGLKSEVIRRVYISYRMAHSSNKLELLDYVLKERQLFIESLLDEYGDLSNVRLYYHMPGFKNQMVKNLENANAYEIRFYTERLK